jgi:hypothetical protein
LTAAHFKKPCKTKEVSCLIKTEPAPEKEVAVEKDAVARNSGGAFQKNHVRQRRYHAW